MLDQCKFTSGSVILLHSQHEPNKKIKTYWFQLLHPDIICIAFTHHGGGSWSPASKQAESKVLPVNFLPLVNAWVAVSSGPNPRMVRWQTWRATLSEVWSTLARFPVVIFCSVSQRSRPPTGSKDSATFLCQDHTTDSRTWRPCRRRRCPTCQQPAHHDPILHRPRPRPPPAPSSREETPAVGWFQLLWQHFLTLHITPAEMMALALDDGHANMCVDKSAALPSHAAAR